MNVIEIDKYVPNHQGQCTCCGQSPTVTAEKGGKIVYDSELCGACNFGEAECADPAAWNE